MHQHILYFAPGTCARVPMIALEEISEPFETKLLAFMKGEHKSPDYLAINPSGKVPALITEHGPLTENVAILTYLARKYPEARLLPLGAGAYDDAKVVSDLAWCSSGIHPIITRTRLPQFFCDHEEGRNRVREIAFEAIKPQFALIEQRLSDSPWMLGDTWSVLDAYIFWIWFRLETNERFDMSPYPKFNDHARRIQERPSVQRALAREAEANKWLDENGLGPNYDTFGLKK